MAFLKIEKELINIEVYLKIIRTFKKKKMTKKYIALS